MPRNAPSPTVSINFVTDEPTRAAVLALAQLEDRSVSAEIRQAIRAHLAAQSRPPAQQCSGQESTAST